MDEKGKLNYTKYLGGSKHRLSELQDSYHNDVGQIHNLDRGMKGSKANHQDIDNFYSMVNETVSIRELPEPEPREGFFKKEATEALQNLYDSLKNKYLYLRKQFENLSAEHTELTTKYKKLKHNYDSLRHESEHIEEIKDDRTLLYSIVEKSGYTPIYDRLKEARQRKRDYDRDDMER